MGRFTLIKDESGYALNDALSRQHPLRVDFQSPQLNYRRKKGGKTELLFKAVKSSVVNNLSTNGLPTNELPTNEKGRLHVWDCTAGLGTDSFLLAARNCRVTMFERSPILALLLEQALSKASLSDEIQSIVNRMKLIKADSLEALRQLSTCDKMETPDVVLIDPMFPTKRKSAQVKGEMQILQRFLGKDEDALNLVRMALASTCPRIVVKRPASGGHLDGLQPTVSYKAKANRFDVYIR